MKFASPVRIFLTITLLALTCTSFTARLAAQDLTVLVGTGSSVPDSLINAWVQEYASSHPKVKITYLTKGTVNGVQLLADGSGDFSAGEVPLAVLMSGKTTKSKLFSVPIMLAGIVPIYNLPGVKQNLVFSGEALAHIFLGLITKWNDPMLVKLNPNAFLPDLKISLVTRTAGKGSNYILTEYLSKTDEGFRAKIGTTSSPKWTVGATTERSMDMAEKVHSTPGSLGFVELDYAEKAKLTIGTMVNAAGKTVKASAESLQAALHANEKNIKEDFRVSLTNAQGADSWPITSFSWIYLSESLSSSQKTKAMSDFLVWTVSSGQSVLTKAGNTPLPGSILKSVEDKAHTMK